MEWAKPAIKVSAAALGVAVAGPLGGALGGLLGEAVGGPAAELIAKYAEKFGDKAGEKLLEQGGDSLAERLKAEAPQLAAVYREALRTSLLAARPEVGDEFDDWFVHWEGSLSGDAPLRLEVLRTEQILMQGTDGVLEATLVRLDGLGALRPGALTFHERAMPEALLGALLKRLPELFAENFAALIVTAKYEAAWKRAGLEFEAESLRLLQSIKEDTAALRAGQQMTHDKLDAQSAAIEAIRQMMLAQAESRDLIRPQELETLRAEAEDWKRRFLEVARADPSLQELLASGDLAGAARKKEEQIARQKSDQAKNYFELGTIEELRFDFAKALDAYREAWQLEKNPDYGFRYGYCAQQQKQFAESIRVYEALRSIYVEPQNIALTLNNLAILYRATQRIREAESAYDKAMSVYRELAANNPVAYLPDIAMTLNNLADLYCGTQRMWEAEMAYGEALSIRRELASSNPVAYLADVAATLNNLAILYRRTQRMEEAEVAYDKALSIRRELASSNPVAYLADVAATLNNLANLYSNMQRMRDAEFAYDDALSIRRELAASNPAVYLPDVAMTQNNLANLYRDTQRMTEAELGYGEALSVQRELAASNPAVYLPDVAMTLNNLATLYGDTQRMTEAELGYLEALSIHRELAVSNPATHLPDVASTLINLTCFSYENEQYDQGEAYCAEAEELLEPLRWVNPAVHGDRMARILWMRVLLGEAKGEDSAVLCKKARRGLAVAYDPTLKDVLQGFVDCLCEG